MSATAAVLLDALAEHPIAFVMSMIVTGTTLLIISLRAPVLDGVPTPQRTPFLGNTVEFIKSFEIMQDVYNTYSRKFKRTWGLSIIRIGFVRNGALVLVTPDTVKHVLKDNFRNYIKGPELTGILGDFLGNGIFTSDGPTWKMHRKVATQMFSKKLLRQGTTVAFRQVRKMCDRIASFAERGEPFDLQSMFYNFTMDTFCYIAFGVDLDSQNNQHSFTKSFDSVQRLSNQRPSYLMWRLRRFLCFPEERKIARGVREMHSFAKTIIAAKRRTLAMDGDILGPDLISRFLVRAKKNGTSVTDKELIDLVLNFIIAGRDTTAAALSWTFYELLTQKSGKDVVRRVIDEVEAKVRETSRTARSVDEVSEDESFKIIYGGLPYSKSVLMEGLRLHPSVPKDIKFAVNDDVLPDGTRVNAGMAIMYVPYAMGRDPAIWEDPLTFDPDRWIRRKKTTRTESDAEEKKSVNESKRRSSSSFSSSLFTKEVSEFAYPVFNAGPRICIGRPLALLELQLVLTSLLPKFQFEPVGTYDGVYTQTIVPPIKRGLRVRAKLRK